MAQTDIRETTTTGMKIGVPDFSVSGASLDSPYQDEFYYINENWTKYYGYYENIPELKSALDSFATWVVGKGYEVDARTKVILEGLVGQGKESDDLILFNLFIIKKINGDAYAQIIRNKDQLINLKVLNPQRVRIVYDKAGLIKRYDYLQNDSSWKKIDVDDMLHLINDKIGDSVHGTSVIKSCQWIIDARNEAMNDWRRVLHRSTIRVLYVDEDSELQVLKNQYKEAIKNGELLLLPIKRGEGEFQDLSAPPIQAFIEWIRYLEGFFYQAVRVGRIIATSEGTTEAGGKVGYLTFEPTYTREQQIIEADFWNQLQLRIIFNRPPSLSTMLQSEQQKNQVQTGFQQSEFQVGQNE